MDIEDQFSLDHLLFKERRCRVCGETKDLLSEFYVIRREKKYLPSAYSYECKNCTINRILKKRKRKSCDIWEYPDW